MKSVHPRLILASGILLLSVVGALSIASVLERRVSTHTHTPIVSSLRTLLSPLSVQQVQAVVGTATFSGGTGTVTGAQFIDAQNTAYFIDPAATGTSLVVAGNVGIGTTGPSQLLNIVGSSATILVSGSGASGGSGEPQLRLTTTNTGGPTTWSFRAGSSNSIQNLRIGTTGSQDMINIDTSGNVGIGVAGPSQKLEVAGTIYSTSGGFKFPDATTQTTKGATSFTCTTSTTSVSEYRTGDQVCSGAGTGTCVWYPARSDHVCSSLSGGWCSDGGQPYSGCPTRCCKVQ